ncbi:DNA-processing protein DprA [Marinovum sp. 2_MG-2023]|uniref:DNA-processing protein DprA n=1 Tax=unclassified Marinovum TaxID=2647166 RepID=UPI0026E45E28|nr:MULTISPECIES: DNA-processing protein DprA [unclassified Marinovum]MDO6730860.1 DNA-processing protein DprA [Marinovum sp. 2_MG-2023]MDO6779935.1 DNA-processing protein DprA [Marinovum sp. 1_MG-2023]
MTDEKFSSTHPLLPPTSEDDRLDWLRLLRSRRVGVTTFYRLMAEHGNAAAALAALPDIARAAGLKDYEACPPAWVAREYAAGRRAKARLICYGDADYPTDLADLADAPPMLWARGDLTLLRKPMLALVGARNASSLGTRMARALASELGEAGFVVVSGLARGVDTAAHLAALEMGTVAVFAGGVDVTYPAENTRLAEDIAARGVILSEQPIGMTPQARHFPMRNRIISGLSRGVIVVEAAAKSGSLITARNALDQGRDVLAVPGHPFDARAGGCNMLIRDGAQLVRNAADVIEAVGPALSELAEAAEMQPDLPLGPTPPPQKRTLRETAALHSQILSRLAPSPVAEDQLIRDLKGESGTVAAQLTDLELDGKITRHPGGLISLSP